MNIGASKGVAKVVGKAGSVQRGIVGGALTGVGTEQVRVGVDEQRLLNPLEAVTAGTIGSTVGGGLTAVGQQVGAKVNKVRGQQAFKKGNIEMQLPELNEPRVLDAQNQMLIGRILGSSDANNIPMVGTPEFRQRYVEPTVIESADMLQEMFTNKLVQGGNSPTTGRRFDWLAFARVHLGNRRNVAAKIQTVGHYKIPAAWTEIRKVELQKWNNIYGDAMANFKIINSDGQLVARPIPERRINLDHKLTLVQSLGMYNNTKPGGNMYNRIQRRVLERGYVAGDATRNLEMAEPYSHAQKSAFFNKIAGAAGETWWNGKHRNTGYTRYEWMQGKARRNNKMTDIWDSKTRRQKHVNGTGAAADAHMEVVDDWMDMIDEGNKILKSGMNFFKANETELDPFEVGELLAEVDINNWSVPKLKQLIADAEAKGLGVPIAKKSEQEINRLAKDINPFIHKQIAGKKKDVEKLFRIILSDSTGRKLKKEIAEVEAHYGDGTEFIRQLTLAFDSIKPALTPQQEQMYRYKLSRIMSIFYNDPKFGRFDLRGIDGGGAGGALDDI
tara:strand:- start:44 stop:1714 length:1671 start_codon:yes stop_codon:yes gene_type:complete